MAAVAVITLFGSYITTELGAFSDGTVQPVRLSVPVGQINSVSVGKPQDLDMGGEINVSRFSTSAVSWFEDLGIIVVADGTTAGMSTCRTSS